MKVGIKVGPKDGIKILEKSQAKYVEVWFRLDWQEKYLPLFEYLNKNKVNFGLHFWAVIKGKYFPNLLGTNKEVREQTLKLAEDTAGTNRWRGHRYA